MSATTAAAVLEQIDYPESDGKPMGETDTHRREMAELIALLQRYYAQHPDVYVSGNLMLYYEAGNPRRVTSPDVFVVKGVARGERRVYKLWEEGQPPAVVLEITSRSTRREDVSDKRLLYARLGVREYYLFDPLGEYLEPSLQGFVLREGVLVPLPADADGGLVSQELGLSLQQEGSALRLTDLATGKPLLRSHEIAAALAAAEQEREAEATARREAEQEREAEATARREAEAEVERLRAELARLRQQ